MSIYEKVKSLFCSPTDNCCEILCSRCKGQSKSSPKKGSDEYDEEPPSKLKLLISKIQSATPQRKPSAGTRRQTGWDPKAKPAIDEDEDDDDEDEEPPPDVWKSKKSVVVPIDEDDDEPPPDVWKSKKSVVFPLSVTSTGPYMKRSASKDPVKSRWANKETTIYSTVTIPEEKASRYMVKSNLQYFVMIPANKARRPSTQKTTPKTPTIPITPLTPTPPVEAEEENPLLEESAKIEEVSELPIEEKFSSLSRGERMSDIPKDQKISDISKEGRMSDVLRKRNVIEESELDKIKKFRASEFNGGKDSGESGSGNEIKLSDVPKEEKSSNISKEGRMSDVSRKRNVIEESELDKIETFRASKFNGGKDSGESGSGNEIKLSDVPKEEKSSESSKEESDVDRKTNVTEEIELDKIKKHKDSDSKGASESKGGKKKFDSDDESDTESDSESESSSDDSSIRSPPSKKIKENVKNKTVIKHK